MYSVEEIKELLKAFDHSKATKLEIKNEKGEVFNVAQKTEDAVTLAPASAAMNAVQSADKSNASPFIREEELPSEEGTAVTSPMVGVFYAAPSPDQEPYVSVGTQVKQGDVLCLIEAMKLMNEVTAEKSGEICAVCVDNGQVVEYGQPLFMIK